MSLFRPYELTSTTASTATTTTTMSAVATGPSLTDLAATNQNMQMAMLLAAHSAAAAARVAEMEAALRSSTASEAESHTISDHGLVHPRPRRSESPDSPITLTSGSPNHD